MKKVLVVLVLAILVFVLCSCSSDTEHVRIRNDHVIIDNLILTIRRGYQLSEDLYSIEETAKGYDIVIHTEKIEIDRTGA